MQKTVNKASERKAAYIFILPAVVLLAAFLIYPSLQTVRYAFTDYTLCVRTGSFSADSTTLQSCFGTRISGSR